MQAMAPDDLYMADCNICYFLLKDTLSSDIFSEISQKPNIEPTKDQLNSQKNAMRFLKFRNEIHFLFGFVFVSEFL